MWSDAIPGTTSMHASAAVSGDRLLDRLIDFFNRPPQVVRGKASLVIAALSGDEFVDLSEDFDFKYVLPDAAKAS
jgi:hypothetical protein